MEVKVEIQQCKTTLLQVKVTHLKSEKSIFGIIKVTKDIYMIINTDVSM